MSGSGRSAAIAAAGVAGVAGWLWWAPAAVGAVAGAVAGPGGEALFTVGVFGPLILLAVAGGWAGGVPAWRLGDAPARAVGFGTAIGLGGLVLGVALAGLAGAASWRGAGTTGVAIGLGLLVVGVQVLAEELVFRGWLQPLVARVVGTPIAVVGVAAAFAMLHLLGGAEGALTLVNLAGGGLLFGMLAARDGGIAGALAAHFAWNAGEQLLLGLDPNPGLGSFGAVLDLDLAGAASWGGSAAGLNASWAMAIALAALTVPLALRWRVAAAR